METPIHGDEAQGVRKLGGWITFPFLGGGMLGLGIALGGATGNIIVYLIKEFNVKSIDAAQISNIVNGCTSLAPLAGAIISDGYFGCYPVVAVSTVISFLACVLFTLTATLPSLRPSPCNPNSGACEKPSAWQLSVFYTAIALIAIGTGGTRFNIITFGANQFDKLSDQDSFFNWYFVMFYVAAIISSTVIVYIQDSVSWGLGFGICAVANAIGLVMLLAGGRYYRRQPAEGSPFTGLARVVVAAVKKRKMVVPEEGTGCYYVGSEEETSYRIPSQGFRCLNSAALIADGETDEKGSIQKPWRRCTVEQVEDLKCLLRITPLWSTAIFVAISIGIQMSLSVLQGLTMDRALSHRFTLPAGSIPVATIATIIIALPFLDRLLFPFILSLTGRAPSTLQRIGVGHVLNVVGMAASALVERRRAMIVHTNGASNQPNYIVPMSVLWLAIPLALQGVGEAMHFPAQVALYYQEFPKSLKSTGTGMIALIVAIGFYMSTVVVDLVRKVTSWLPDNLNDSRLDNVYWMLAIVGAVNFGYYMVCANLYKLQNVPKGLFGSWLSETSQVLLNSVSLNNVYG